MSGGIDSSRVQEFASEWFLGRANTTVNNILSPITGALDLADAAGVETGANSWLGNIFSAINNFFRNLFSMIGRQFNPQPHAALEAFNGSIENAAASLNNIDQALGITSGGTQEVVQEAVDSFLEGGRIPRMDTLRGAREATDQTATREAILQLRGNLATHYVRALAQQHPDIARSNPAAIEGAADYLAGVVSGYPTLPESTNRDILLATIGEPAAGSIGDLMMKGQLRAYGPNRESVSVPSISFSQEQLTRATNILNGTEQSPGARPPAPTSYDREMIAQADVWMRYAAARGVTFNDTNGDGQLSVDDILPTLAAAGVTQKADIISIERFAAALNIPIDNQQPAQGQGR